MNFWDWLLKEAEGALVIWEKKKGKVTSSFEQGASGWLDSKLNEWYRLQDKRLGQSYLKEHKTTEQEIKEDASLETRRKTNCTLP